MVFYSFPSEVTSPSKIVVVTFILLDMKCEKYVIFSKFIFKKETYAFSVQFPVIKNETHIFNGEII